MSDPKWLAEDRRFAQKEVPMGVWSSPVSTIAETVRALQRAHAEIDRLTGRVRELETVLAARDKCETCERGDPWCGACDKDRRHYKERAGKT